MLLLGEAAEVFDIIPDNIPDKEPGEIFTSQEIVLSTGLDHVPLELWPKIDKVFANEFLAVVRAIAIVCQASNLNALPVQEHIKAVLGNKAPHYFRKGGKIDYVQDFICSWATDMSVLRDGSWDEAMDEEVAEGGAEDWKDLPECANDLNFGLVRQQMGIKRYKMGPYFPDDL